MKVLVRNAHDNFRLFCACLSLLMVGVTNAYAQANPRFSEVDPVSKEVTVTNYGDQAIDLSSYWLCLGGGTYVMIGDVSPVSGAINLMPDASVTLPYNFLQAASGGLGLYNSSSFLSAAAMDDYVQWGAGGAQRESIAVMASLWVAGEFVDTPSPYVYTGDGSQNGLSAWNAVVDGGTLTGGPFEFCVGDGVADNIADGAITLAGNVGSASQWVITDEQGTILGLPGSFTGPNFDGAGAGTCLVWHLSHDGSLGGAAMGANATTDLTGNYDLSNPISVVRYQPKGGTLTGGPFEFVVGDGVADNIAEGAIELTGNEGGNSQWVVTDETGTILGLPPTPNVVNFDVAGVGTCLVWHLSFDGDLEGAEAGNNAMTDLVGCYSLSNSVTVIRTATDVDGGTLTGGPFEFCVGDGVADNIADGAITLTGNVGSASQWVITDEQGTILGLPDSFTGPNFDGAGAGTCLVWHLSHDGSLAGAAMGANATTDLTGNYDLSNPISVVRYQPKGGTLTGGPFEFVVGDGVADNIAEGAIELTGNEGGNSQWVVTDEAGTILGLPPTPNVVNFDVAGVGTCLVWHLSFDGDLEGAEAGNNAMTDLVGCYSLSNPVEVIRSTVNGGTLTGGPFEFCVGDGVADNIADGAITLVGNVGSASQWVITDEQGTILGLPDSFTGPNFDGAGAGTCLVWHLSHDGSLAGAAMGANATTDLTGNYDLSNPISVIRYQPKGGTLTGGPFEFVVGDGVADNIAEGAIELTGNEGGNSQWVVTDETGTILGLPPTPNVVNFDVAGAGTCLIWHLSFDGDLEGAEAGNNAMTDLVGCYSLSNSVTVVRTAADLDGGTLTGGPFEFCVDGVSDQLGADDIVLSGNVGLESVWVITDEELNILGTPPSFTVPDFDAAGVGVCLVWHLSHDGSLGGADVPNANVSDLTGNYSLSNSVKVTRVAGSDCEALSIGDFNTGLPFSVYPVPARTKLQIQLEEVNASNEITLEVYDLLGKKVMQERTLGVSIALDVSKLQLGSYILAIDNGQGAKATKMFTVIQ